MYQLLETKDAVSAALATMHPLVSDAALTLADLLAREKPQSEEQFEMLVESACRGALYRKGYALDSTDMLIENHWFPIVNVATSIIHVAEKKDRSDTIIGGIALAAAVGIGAVTGIWIG